MKAWRTQYKGVTSIVFAKTRGKALWTTFKAAEDAGFTGSGDKMTDVKAKRAPELDERFLERHLHRCLTESYFDPENAMHEDCL